MKKTLADFKRIITRGLHIEYVHFEMKEYNGVTKEYATEWTVVPVPKERRGARYVSHVDTTGFYLKHPENKAIKGSFCAFPKAGDLVFIDDNFTITDRTSRGEAYQKRSYKIVKYK